MLLSLAVSEPSHLRHFTLTYIIPHLPQSGMGISQVGPLYLFIAAQFLGRPVERDPACLQHISVISYLKRHVGVLLYQQDGHALPVDIADQVKNQLYQIGRQAQGRLVQQQKLWIAHQGPADCQHLLFTAGQGACLLLQAFLEPGE